MKRFLCVVVAIVIGVSVPVVVAGQSASQDVAQDISRITARLVDGEALSDDLRASLATNLRAVASSIDADAFMQLLEATIEEYGGVDSFAAPVLVDSLAARVLAEQGLVAEMSALRGIGMSWSMGDVRDVVNSLREAGRLSIWFTETAALLERDPPRELAQDTQDACNDCDALRAAADDAFKVAAVICVFVASPTCAGAIGAAVGLQAFAGLICAICND